MKRNITGILKSCRGPRSETQRRPRFSSLSSIQSSSSITRPTSVPSFDLGFGFEDELSSSPPTQFHTMPKSVTKRARSGKRVTVDRDDVGVVIGGERCSSFEQIISTSVSPLNSIPMVDSPLSECEVPLNSTFPPIDVVVSEIDIERETDQGIPESDLSIIDLPCDEPNRALTTVHEGMPTLDLGFEDFDKIAFDRAMRTTERNGTTKSNSWVRNRFNDWRVKSGLDVAVALEDIPLRELADHLCKFFFVLKKKNGEHYPSQSVMSIYKGFNRIFCAVQRDRVNSTGVNEPQFLMHAHPFFGRVNKFVILAMKKSILAVANKGRRKVDFFTDEDELKILAHPLHQADSPTGVQKLFAFYACTVYLIRGSSELYNLRLVDFTLGLDEQGKEILRYWLPLSLHTSCCRCLLSYMICVKFRYFLVTCKEIQFVKRSNLLHISR